MLAVFSLFVCVPAAYAASTGALGLGSPTDIAPGGGPAMAPSPQLGEARAAALIAYRGAVRAARTAGFHLHLGPGVIVRTSSVSRLRKARVAWLRREYRYRRITIRRHRVVHAALRQRGTRY